eukprot:scaffold27380_cov36-Phaeocystis_antarctica.AAC.1
MREIDQVRITLLRMFRGAVQLPQEIIDEMLKAFLHKGSVFSEHAFFLRTCQARPMRAHTCPGITRRLCGGLGSSVAQDLRALRLWQSSRQWCAVPWSSIDAEPGCRALRR